MWNYAYKVSYYENDEKHIQYGYVYAPNLDSALSEITSWYGEDYIDEVSFKIVGEGPLRVTEEMMDTINDMNNI